jgi:putative acetyltransferase
MAMSHGDGERSIRFYFSFRSPYAWLAAERLESELGDLGTPIELLPIHPTPEVLANLSATPEKLAYLVQDIARLARERGLTLRFPSPVDPDWSLSHAAFLEARRQDAGHRLMLALFRKRFADGLDLGDDAVIGDAAREARLDHDAIVAAAHSEELRAEASAGWQRAVDRDRIFGVPSFVYAGKLYWGQDRMHLQRGSPQDGRGACSTEPCEHAAAGIEVRRRRPQPIDVHRRQPARRDVRERRPDRRRLSQRVVRQRDDGGRERRRHADQQRPLVRAVRRLRQTSGFGEVSPLHVRPERAGDEVAIARVHDAAFGRADESRIVDAIRRAGRSNVSLVAADGSGVVGHILLTPVVVESAQATVGVMGLGPMAVLPALQRKGVGSQLVREGLQACARTGCRAVVVVGHPEFYPRFGFRAASAYGLRCEYPVPDEVFMAVELAPGVLEGCSGLVRYLREFRGS